MTWLQRLTPFRTAVILLLGAALVSGLMEAFTPSMGRGGGAGGSAWGGVAIISMFLLCAFVWLVDVLMRQLITDFRIIWLLQLIGLLGLWLLIAAS
jgi:hypothetical protein